MNILIVFSALSTLLGFLGGSYFHKSLLFKSAESKTQQGGSVFNEVKFKQQGGLDIWEMKQSHKGLHAKSSDWDNIKIVVDTKVKPMTASFHQLKSGREVEYAANCIRCHSSGPRLIRPSSLSKFTYSEKLTLNYWNLKIKSYGTVVFKENQLINKRKLKLTAPTSTKTITLKKCTQCHKEGGARAAITSFQKGTILHLTKSKKMPPWPYSLTKKEKAQLLDEIYSAYN